MSLPQNSLAQGRARGQSQGDSQAEPQSELSRVGVRRQRPASGSPSVCGLQGPSLCSDCVCRALPTPPAPHFSCSQLIRACPWEQQPGRGAGEGLPGALQPAAPKKTLDEDLLPCPPPPRLQAAARGSRGSHPVQPKAQPPVSRQDSAPGSGTRGAGGSEGQSPWRGGCRRRAGPERPAWRPHAWPSLCWA